MICSCDWSVYDVSYPQYSLFGQYHDSCYMHLGSLN